MTALPVNRSRRRTPANPGESLLRRVRWTPLFLVFLGYMYLMTSSRVPIGGDALFQLMFTAVSGLAIVTLVLQREPIRFPAPARWLAAFTIWGGMTSFTSEFTPVVVDTTILFAKILIIYLMAVNALRTRAQMTFLFVFMLTWFLLYPARGAFLNYFVYDYTTFGRAMWDYQYENPNDLAALAILQLSAAGALYIIGRPKYALGIGIAAVPTLLFLIVLTQSRGAFLAVLGALAWVVGTGRKKTRMVLTIAAVGAFVIAVAPDTVFERFGRLTSATNLEAIDRLDDESSAEGRWDAWMVALVMIRNNPVTGVGLGAHRLGHGRYAPFADINPQFMRPMDAHSTYLRTLSETGFPGLFLFVGMLSSALLYAERIRRRCRRTLPQDASILALLMAGMGGFLLAGVFGSYTDQVMTYIQLAILWSYAKLCEGELKRLPRTQRPNAQTQGRLPIGSAAQVALGTPDIG